MTSTTICLFLIILIFCFLDRSLQIKKKNHNNKLNNIKNTTNKINNNNTIFVGIETNQDTSFTGVAPPEKSPTNTYVTQTSYVNEMKEDYNNDTIVLLRTTTNASMIKNSFILILTIFIAIMI